MNSKPIPSFITWRFYFVLALMTLALMGLICRVFTLSVLQQHFLRHQGDERVLRLVSTPSFRGMIFDRNGFPLAISTTVYSVWINPLLFSPSHHDLSFLARAVGMPPRQIKILALHNQQKKREFVYLKRGLSPEMANKIKALNIEGVFLQQDYRRYYPEGEVAAQVVGFTNVDDQGQEGLELAYNDWLSGAAGKKWVIKDRLGRVISDVQTIQEQQSGHDLILSIDRRLQYLAYRELFAGVVRNQAESGSAVVLDVKTGEVLAMVNYPSFNPNNRPAHLGDNYRNRAVTDTFEPGSTMKAFTVASAFEAGKFKPDAVIDTSPGVLRLGRNKVSDEKNNGLLSIAQILQISSNVGAAKIALTLPPNELWNLFSRMGFGEDTGIRFPGERNGVLTQRPAGSFSLVTMAFGYGLSATTLQLARAYAVIADSGIKRSVSLIRLDKPPVGEKVLDANITQQMLALLETVVSGGTGKPARIPGYRVAGKTGTSKIVGEEGYQKHRYTSSFVGIAPMTSPRLIVVVVIHDPHGKRYYGGEISGPVFEKIMEGSLRTLDVSPDAPLKAGRLHPG